MSKCWSSSISSSQLGLQAFTLIGSPIPLSLFHSSTFSACFTFRIRSRTSSVIPLCKSHSNHGIKNTLRSFVDLHNIQLEKVSFNEKIVTFLLP